MIAWSEEHLIMRDAVRRFVEAEIAPNIEELEHGDTPPYDILRKMFRTFGIDEAARQRFARQIERARGGEGDAGSGERESSGAGGDALAMQIIPIIELSRYCPGMVTALGVSVGLTAGAINSKGTVEQRERWALDLMTPEIGRAACRERG